MTTVGPAGWLDTSIRPSTVDTRCASPARPLPRAASAGPMGPKEQAKGPMAVSE